MLRRYETARMNSELPSIGTTDPGSLILHRRPGEFFVSESHQSIASLAYCRVNNPSRMDCRIPVGKVQAPIEAATDQNILQHREQRSNRKRRSRSSPSPFVL